MYPLVINLCSIKGICEYWISFALPLTSYHGSGKWFKTNSLVVWNGPAPQKAMGLKLHQFTPEENTIQSIRALSCWACDNTNSLWRQVLKSVWTEDNTWDILIPMFYFRSNCTWPSSGSWMQWKGTSIRRIPPVTQPRWGHPYSPCHWPAHGGTTHEDSNLSYGPYTMIICPYTHSTGLSLKGVFFSPLAIDISSHSYYKAIGCVFLSVKCLFNMCSCDGDKIVSVCWESGKVTSQTCPGARNTCSRGTIFSNLPDWQGATGAWHLAK